jgi:hypothetical protein
MSPDPVNIPSADTADALFAIVVVATEALMIVNCCPSVPSFYSIDS